MTVSARPLESSRSGSVPSQSRSATTRRGLTKAPDEVLALGQVHPDLAADGAIHHREEGGRQHDEVNAAHVGTGDEAAEVPHHAAAEREERGIAGEPEARQVADGLRVGSEALG